MHSPDQTIVALSTPPGRGGIAVVRLSGPRALECARTVIMLRGTDQISPATALLGWIRDPRQAEAGAPLDRGYLVFHPAGHSYTGDDVAELSCHASPVVVEQLLEALVHAGARPAEPGEFTYRAVLSGRMDLAQAEAVRDLIEAPTAAAARAAQGQLRGDLSRCVTSMRETLIEIISRLEARLEFAEEPDLQERDLGVARPLRDLEAAVRGFVASYRQGRMLREGARVALAGRPNAGKSSLFNRLLRTERAIVSSEPGTTRDFISETIDLDGIAVRLTDTAGLREGARGIEAQGVERARKISEQADLVLVLCPCDEEPDSQDERLLGDHLDGAMLVASKADLLDREPPAWSKAGILVSSETGAGIESLRGAIFTALAGAPGLTTEAVIVADARHHDALRSCSESLARGARAQQEGASEEIVLVELYSAMERLGEITGAVTVADIHERIFSTFCIGK
ncbi:MAG TPA: tRNA uridine-5-carboxymethylaminomethyl(34) synthesis GTPase MnmE [Patescibacteria group bacterium]|nr:tRNA uridine-5-carboxymethylaminomethyl(34) synthesis GTPase MnmE [Patescibacteria group bacterium]